MMYATVVAKGCQGINLAQQIKPLAHELAENRCQSCHVAASDQAEFKRIGAEQEKYWNSRGGVPRRKRRGASIESHDHGHLALDEFCRKRQQSPSLVICPAEFYRHVAALDVARRCETLEECRYAADPLPRRTQGQVPDHRYRLLRPEKGKGR
jgi:hypothetical protein